MTFRPDPDTEDLDDVADRAELRQRYYGLLQELRVLLPGVQILVAFLLTAPFANRFGDLTDVERTLYGISLLAGLAAIVVFAAPIAMHRVGDRRARVERMLWGVRLQMTGLALTALALLAAFAVVWSVVFSGGSAVVIVSVFVAFIAVTWIVIPRRAGTKETHGNPVVDDR